MLQARLAEDACLVNSGLLLYEEREKEKKKSQLVWPASTFVAGLTSLEEE